MTRSYQKATKEEIKTIIDTYKKDPKMSQKDIGDQIGRVQSYVYYIIKGYEKGNKRILNLYNDGTETFKAGGSAIHLKQGKVAVPKPGETVIVKSKAPKEKKPKPATRVVKTILPGKHAAIPHKLSDQYKNLDRKELGFLQEAKNSNEFIVKYFKNFGYDTKTVSMLNEVWKRREDILQYEEDKKNHTIVKPQNPIITERLRIDPRKASAFVEDEAMSNLSNKISVLTQYFKEVIDLEQDIVTSISKMSEPKA